MGPSNSGIRTKLTNPNTLIKLMTFGLVLGFFILNLKVQHTNLIFTF